MDSGAWQDAVTSCITPRKALPNQFSDLPQITPGLHEERKELIVKLRRGGHTWQQIADHISVESGNMISPAMCAADWRAVMNMRARELREDLDAVRLQSLERLDVALKAIWSRVESGDDEAIELMLKIEARRAHLSGLDAPLKLKIGAPASLLTQTEFAEKLQALRARMAQKGLIAAQEPQQVIDVAPASQEATQLLPQTK